MLDSDDKRPVMLGEYLAANNVTVRQTAAHFGISKSTVHKDITVRLKELDEELFERVRQVLDRNKALRHIRGGQATRNKYKAQTKE
ncbi:sporulation transcriptional regulator SpoIIID [Ruminococcus sp. NK3A76]|uniref:sporulation transcriptional regulator SpoIIID n=1 Tax=Ruminococcus sp. NK3A76 TaxID=877411 RepID=UPI000490E053|nr:sporulation transcriptional regulator SpoIIID [Ruminococcus sp. NK3A76]